MTQGDVLAVYATRTGREAGDKFAASHWGEPRTVAEWQEGRFRLEYGRRWFLVRAGTGRSAGLWEIVAGPHVDQAPAPLAYPCPACGVAAGAKCLTAHGKDREPHTKRIKAAGG